MSRSTIALLFLTACAPRATTLPVEHPRPPAVAHVERPIEAGMVEDDETASFVLPARRPPARTVVHIEADLDGDGTPETIELLSDGRLRIGELELQVLFGEDDGTSDDDEEWRLPVLRVVDVDVRDPYLELLITGRGEGDVDPADELDLWTLRDGVLGALSRPIAMSHGAEVLVPGDGTLELRSAECVADGRTARSRVVLEVDPHGMPRPVLEETRYEDSACLEVGVIRRATRDAHA